MRVLVGCEFSGTVREAFRKHGHDAWSCDLLPADDNSPHHIQDDILNHLNDGWELAIMHPPCTYLSNSGVRWLHTEPGRWADMIDGAVFFRTLLNAPIPRIAVENPIIHRYARTIIGQPHTQLIQPWMFGHPETKATCLWLRRLPPLVATDDARDRMAALPKSEQARVHWASPGPDRWKARSVTYTGIADAMAEQWTAFLEVAA